MITESCPVYKEIQAAVEQANELFKVSLLVNRTNRHLDLSPSPAIFSLKNKGPKHKQVEVDGAECEGHSKLNAIQGCLLIVAVT